LFDKQIKVKNKIKNKKHFAQIIAEIMA